jgi:hypothetical protein
MTRSSARRLVGALAALGLAACSTELGDGAAPRPEAVTPPAGYRAGPTEVTIRGEGFRVEPYQDAGGAPAVDAAFRAWLGEAELEGVRWISRSELRARVPAGLPPGPHALRVQDPRGASGALDGAFTAVEGDPPALTATATLAPAVASVGQPVTLRVEIRNAGDVRAASVRPAVELAGAALRCSAPPPAEDVDPGAIGAWPIACEAVEAGTATARASAEGWDPVGGVTVRTWSPGVDDVRVQPRASLAVASASAAPARASVGQLVAVEVVYENPPGVAGVMELRPEVTELVGPGGLDLVSGPGACDVAAGGTCTAAFLFGAAAPGTVEVRIDAAGKDANDGVTPEPAPRATALVEVQRPPRLRGSLTVDPRRASVDQLVAVTLEVSNDGEVAATGFAPRITARPVGALLASEEPGPQHVPAAGTATFQWTYAMASAGPGAFVAEGVGWDANGAGSVALAAVTSDEVLVQTPAALSARAGASPRRVSSGQAVAVTLEVTNSGEAEARLTPYLEASATGSASFTVDPQDAVTIAGLGTVELAWSAAVAGRGTLTFVPRVAGRDANDGTQVAAADPAPIVTVQRPARLTASVEVPPAVAGGQRFLATVEVANEGEAAAVGVSPRLAAAAGAAYASGPTPAGPVRVEGGATARFEWAWDAAAAPTTATFDADVAGTDENSGAGLAAAAGPRTVLVQRAATLSAEIVAAPERVNLGRPFGVAVRVTNAGDRPALDVETLVDCPACAAGEPPAIATIPAHGAIEVARTFTPEALGTVALAANALGYDDAAHQDPIWAGTVERPLAVEQPARLSLAHRGPAAAPTLGFGVEVEAANPGALPGFGQAAAQGVVPGDLLVVLEPDHLGTADLACAPWQAAPATLPAGATARFGWTCTATRPGRVRLQASVAGEDANDHEPLLATTTFELALAEVAQVAQDPFGDGASFSYVFGYDGHVFLGPSGDGRGVVRCAPDGTGCASFAFKLWRDTTEVVVRGDGTTATTSVSENVLCPDLVTLGAAPGCDASSPEKTPCLCGPDYEVGRGVLGSFRLGDERDEWLVAMGRAKKRGDLNYAYMTRDVDSPLELLYADLYVAIPPAAGVENVISMAELNGRLYLGLQVDSAERPRMVVLTRTPTFPGLDATPAEAFATTFQGTAMGERGGGTWPISQVDALLGFEGRLFVANRSAVLVSRNGFPGTDASSQFDECTPLPPSTWETTGVGQYPAKQDVTPADKGVTGMVAWSGRLYLARNTAGNVPELWVFTPRRDPGTGAFLGCAVDRSDWRRVATHFRDPANTHLTALFASDRYLYVGYDDAGGVQLWRTDHPAPQDEAAFTGTAGCRAFTVVDGVTCRPVGGAGFGDPLNTRFFDANRFGAADQIWATVGNPAAPVRVFRIAE